MIFLPIALSLFSPCICTFFINGPSFQASFICFYFGLEYIPLILQNPMKVARKKKSRLMILRCTARASPVTAVATLNERSFTVIVLNLFIFHHRHRYQFCIFPSSAVLGHAKAAASLSLSFSFSIPSFNFVFL